MPHFVVGGHYFVLSVGGTGLLCKGRGPSQFVKPLLKVTNSATDPFIWFYNFRDQLLIIGRETVLNFSCKDDNILCLPPALSS